MINLKATSLVVLLSCLAFAQATVVTREAEGEAAIVGKDEQRAFKEAQDIALRTAIEQAAGVRIDADTVVVNNQLVRDQIFSSASGYVKTFSVTEKKVEKNVVKVRVKAEIITDTLDKDIQAARDVVKRVGTPSLLIVIQEQTLPADGKGVTNSEAMASVLTEEFRKDGWLIKDQQAINGKLRLEGAVTLGPTELKEIADLSKASYVLYGKVSFRQQRPDGLMKGSPNVFVVTGEYDLAIAATDTAEQIEKLTGSLTWDRAEGVPMVSYERTTQDLVKLRKKEISAGMRKAILEHFRDQVVNGQHLSVGVSGLESFGAAKELKKSLETIKGMKDATQDGFVKGRAHYRITYLGTAQELAEQVEAATFKKKKLNIVSVSGGSLEVQVAK